MKGENVMILFWTKYYGSDNFIQNHGESIFHLCPEVAERCQLTNNRSLIHKSDAIIFHIRDLDINDMPKYRSPEQRWIFFLIESPRHTHKEEILKNLPPEFLFNWTLTYR